jgi:branched-chain amino acid transport system substrate-binding protein
MRFLLIVALVISLPIQATSKKVRVAGIYPNHTRGHLNCTCGLEAACITNAAVKRAKSEGIDLDFTPVNKDWDVFGTLAASERVANQKFDVAVGTLVSADALVASKILETAGIPFIVPTATHPNVTAGKKFVTRIPFNDYRQASLLARLSVTDLRANKLAVVRNASTPYSDFLGKEFASVAKKLAPGVEIQDYPIFEEFTKFNDLVDKILQHKPDLLFVPLSQAQIASIYVALANRGASLTILSSDTVEKTPKFLEMMAPISEDIHFIYPKHWNGKFEGPEANRYLSLHKKYCSQYEASMTTMAAYDAIELVIRALKQNPSARGKELVQLIRSIPYDGMTGKMVYGADGDPIKPIELYRVEGKDVIFWKRYE